ncbi:MAG: methyltransferase domain-containing protein, partial [Patescibacteria group bacterium]
MKNNSREKIIKLNLGSKQRKLPGFDNLDKIFGWHFQDGLPQYGDNSVEGITISHALMFLTLAELETFMGEMWRVLKNGGVVRITEDDTENPKSSMYKTGNIKSGPNCLTGPKMMRTYLEKAGFTVYDVDRETTHFHDKSLMQAYRGGAPKFFFIEGVKEVTSETTKSQTPETATATKPSALLEGIKHEGKPYEIVDC